MQANPDAAAKIPSDPLAVEVERTDRDAVFGMPIPLDIMVRNNSQRAIWIDENHLPWTWFPAYQIQVNSPFLTLCDPCGIGCELQPKRLDPGEELHGRVHLSRRLTVPEWPPTTVTVPVTVVMTLRVNDDIDPKPWLGAKSNSASAASTSASRPSRAIWE